MGIALVGRVGVMAYLSRAPTVYRGPIPAILLFTVIYACPYAVFGYMVGRPKLGVIVGIVFSALFIIIFAVITPSAVR